MNKKAWIMIAACCGLLGMNYVLGNPQETAPAADQQAKAEAPAATAAATGAATEATGETPAVQNPAPAPTPEVKGTPSSETSDDKKEESAPGSKASPTDPATDTPPPPAEIAPLISRDENGNEVARFHFQKEGGSLKCVEMVGQAIDSTHENLRQNVCLNSNAPHGIGTLMCNLDGASGPAYERLVYRERERTADSVTLSAESRDEIIRKIYSLKPLKEGDEVNPGNAYVLRVSIAIQNKRTQGCNYKNYGIYGGAISQISKYEGSSFVKFLTVDDGSYKGRDAGDFSHWFGKDEKRRFVSDCDNLDWVGLTNQYYATALAPGEHSKTTSYYVAPTKLALPVTGNVVPAMEIAIGLPEFELSAATDTTPGKLGGSREFTFEYFAGPKYCGMLSDMTGEFRKIDRVMDYGIFYLISRPMNWVINMFHSLFGNWGWAIVAMTFVVRLIIWPLYRKSYVSMKRMSLLQPQMKELKEKYQNDPQRVQLEMMGLYRRYGINPLGGCLPMLLQMPIFLSFFWVLQTAAELRGAAWLGWVTDLSMPDTVWEYTMPFSIPFIGDTICLNVLPFLMIISMYVMMRMTPQTPGSDKMQRVIMRIMPIFFFLFCYNYASALALYWTTTNIISMIQTLIIRRLPMPQLKEVDTKAKKGGKKGFMQRMYEAQQQALKEQQGRMRNVTRR